MGLVDLEVDDIVVHGLERPLLGNNSLVPVLPPMDLVAQIAQFSPSEVANHYLAL